MMLRGSEREKERERERETKNWCINFHFMTVCMFYSPTLFVNEFDIHKFVIYYAKCHLIYLLNSDAIGDKTAHNRFSGLIMITLLLVVYLQYLIATKPPSLRCEARQSKGEGKWAAHAYMHVNKLFA